MQGQPGELIESHSVPITITMEKESLKGPCLLYFIPMSLELRWIFASKTPDPVNQWFYHDKRLGDNNTVEKQEYEDIYLYNPEVDYSSVKFRDKKLDIKWKCSSFNIYVKATNISGIVEDWVFWEWNERKTA